MQIPHTISVSTKKTKLKVQFVISLNSKHTITVSTIKLKKNYINLKCNANLNDEPQMQKRVNFVRGV